MSESQLDEFPDSSFDSADLICELSAGGDEQALKTALETLDGSLDARDEQGLTPLHHACRTGNERIVEVLLAHMPDHKVRTAENARANAPQHAPACAGLDTHGTGQSPDYSDIVVMCQAVYTLNGCAARGGRQEVLLSGGWRVSKRTFLTMPHQSLQPMPAWCHKPSVLGLVQNCRGMTIQTPPGASPACQRPARDLKPPRPYKHTHTHGTMHTHAPQLAQRLAVLPAPLHHGASPLHFAAQHTHSAAVLHLLLERLGALGDTSGDTYNSAAAAGLAAPAAGGGSGSAVAAAAAELLDVVDDRQQTLLHYAAAADNAPALGLLLPHFGRRLGVDARDAAGATPLAAAAAARATAAAGCLLAAGAGLVPAPPRGWSPLHFAAMHDNDAMLRLLFEHAKRASGGRPAAALAELNAPDAEARRTPLHVAAEYGCAAAAAALLDLGADPTRRDQSGSTPLHLAAERGWGEVAAVLARATAAAAAAAGAAAGAAAARSKTGAGAASTAAAARIERDWAAAATADALRATLFSDAGLAPMHLAAAANSVSALGRLAEAGHSVEVRAVLPAVNAPAAVRRRWRGCSSWTPLHFAGARGPGAGRAAGGGLESCLCGARAEDMSWCRLRETLCASCVVRRS